MGRKLRDQVPHTPMHIRQRLINELRLPGETQSLFRRVIARAKRRFPAVRFLDHRLGTGALTLTAVFPDDPKQSCARVMQWLGTTLARNFNLLWGRGGKVFYDRYWSLVLRTVNQVKKIIAWLGKG